MDYRITLNMGVKVTITEYISTGATEFYWELINVNTDNDCINVVS